ncbi:MAG: hypothetical protein J2P18_07525 [Nocardia sp.]|nr:hypothetical protein [Nocardia sp.]
MSRVRFGHRTTAASRGPRVTTTDEWAVPGGGLAAEVDRLRAQVAARDERIAALTAEMAAMGRRVDDLLDRESMHAYDADMERLATPAAIDRIATRRAPHANGDHGGASAGDRARPELENTQPGTRRVTPLLAGEFRPREAVQFGPEVVEMRELIVRARTDIAARRAGRALGVDRRVQR